jgi:peptidoglycan/LPS O-acetylase OafA/YrhL
MRTTSSPRRLEALGGLRAIAAGLVLAYHLGQATAAARLHLLEPFVAGFKAGVTIFFVISGFLLYLPYARALGTRAPLPSWRRFARRRAVRIVPGYWVALTIVALAPLPGSDLGSDWWRFFTFTQTYSHSTVFGGLDVAWTLCVEVAFYALLPVFAWALARLVRRAGPGSAARIQLAAVAALALGTIGLRFALNGSLTAPTGAHGYLLATSLPGLLDWFAIGLALAVVASEWEANPTRFAAVRAMADRPGGCWLLATCFYVIAVAACPVNVDVFLPDYGLLAHVAIGIAAGLLVLPAIDPSATARRSVPIRLLTHRWAAWLGMISYGIYLWHLQLLKAIDWPFSRVALHPPSLLSAIGLTVVTVAGAIALGAASWYLVELPAQRLVGKARKRPALGGLHIRNIRAPAFRRAS